MMKAALFALLLGACGTPEYTTNTPECFTGVVQALKEEKVIKDVDNTGPYYATRSVRQVQTDEGRTVYVHGMGPGQGEKVRVCVYAPRDYAVLLDHFFPKMRDPDQFIQKYIYKVTAEEIP